MPDELPQPSQWEAIARWLTEHPETREALTAAELPEGSLDATIDRLTVLSERPGAPPVLVAAVTGGYVGKLVQIARADTVNVMISVPELPLPAQLPRRTPDFVNRGTELDRLRAALADTAPESRVLTITSRAGIGKSALAVRFAHELIGDFPDAQLYVDLRGTDQAPVDAGQVLTGFLLALGIPGERIPPTVPARQMLYRSLLATRRALVLVDNASTEQQVELLVPGGAGCVVVATSRRPLAGLDVTEHIVLESFSEEHAVELLARLGGVDRIAAEPEAARRIASYCGHLPLALRIAGTRLRSRPDWKVRTFADRLGDEHRRLDELSAGDRDVRGSFDLSYRQLAPPLARAFRLLSLTPGADFGRPAATAVLGCTDDEADRLLDELVDVALLEYSTEDRWRYHDLIRIFAAERTVADESADERIAARSRVLEMYRERGQHWLSLTIGEYRADPGAVEWFDTDGANALAAANIAFEAGEWDTVISLAASLHHLLSLRGRSAELEQLLALAATAAANSGDIGACVHATVRLAEVIRFAERGHETPILYERALALTERGDGAGARPWVLTHFGDAYRELGEPQRARECYTEALHAYVAAGDAGGEAWVRTHLGDALGDLGESQAAIDAFDRALAYYETFSDGGGRSWVLMHMVDTLEALSRSDEVDAAFRMALDLARTNEDPVNQEWVLQHQGDILVRRGAWAEAARVFREAASVAEHRGDGLAVRMWSRRAAEAESRLPQD